MGVAAPTIPILNSARSFFQTAIVEIAMENRRHQFARDMRAQPTAAERVLWRRLRHDVTLVGSHFRRQALIGPFIVDFASRKAKLVIELDGGQHDLQRVSDEQRTRKIESFGYRVLRFWNNDVFANLEGVLMTIQSALPPTPDPSPQGGGEKKINSAFASARRDRTA